MQWNQKTIVLGAAGALVLAALVVAGTRAFDFTGSAGIYPIQVNHKFGFIDKSGKVVVVPQFDDAGIFRDTNRNRTSYARRRSLSVRLAGGYG